jgi:hypothetical protein
MSKGKSQYERVFSVRADPPPIPAIAAGDVQALPSCPPGVWLRLARVPNSHGHVEIHRMENGVVKVVHEEDPVPMSLSLLMDFISRELSK